MGDAVCGGVVKDRGGGGFGELGFGGRELDGAELKHPGVTCIT